MTEDKLKFYQEQNDLFISECERYCDIAAKYDSRWDLMTDFFLPKQSNVVECMGYDMLGRLETFRFDVRLLLLDNKELDYVIESKYIKKEWENMEEQSAS